MAGGHVRRDTTLRKIVFQHIVEQRLLLDLLKGRLGGTLLCRSRRGERHEIPACRVRNILGLREKIRTADQLPGKSKNIAAASCPEIEPDISVRIDLERRCLFLTVGSVVPQIVSFPHGRMMPQPCEEIFYRKPSYPLYIHSFRIRWFPLFSSPPQPRPARSRHFPAWRNGVFCQFLPLRHHRYRTA